MVLLVNLRANKPSGVFIVFPTSFWMVSSVIGYGVHRIDRGLNLLFPSPNGTIDTLGFDYVVCRSYTSCVCDSYSSPSINKS